MKLGKTLENRGLREGTQAHMMAMLHSRPDHIAMSMPLTAMILEISLATGCGAYLAVLKWAPSCTPRASTV